MSSHTVLELIDLEIATLRQARSILGGISASPTVTSPAPKPKRSMSAASRAKIAAAQRKRWAELKTAPK